MSTASGHPGGPASIEIGVERDGGSKMVRLDGWTPGKRFAAGHVGHHPSVARTAVPCCAIGNSAPERPEVRSSRSRHLDEIALVAPGGADAVGISVWDLKEDAETYARGAYPGVLKALAQVVEGTPQVQSYHELTIKYHWRRYVW